MPLASMGRMRRGRGRRKVLLGLLAALLVYAAYAWHVGLAFTANAPQSEMDWNADGIVSAQEAMQAWYAVTVRVRTEGARVCRSYYWRGRENGDPISVSCRTEVAKPAP